MEWSIINKPLIPQVVSFNKIKHKKLSQQQKITIIKQHSNICSSCGGIYQKYLLIDNDNIVQCRACHIITHLNCGYIDEIIICVSPISQLDIVRKTVEYVIDNQQIPHPHDIDTNVQLVPLSIFEYANILKHDNTLQYKIFFTNDLDTDFILNNYGVNITFTDYSPIIPDNEPIKTYNFTDSEIILINKILS